MCVYPKLQKQKKFSQRDTLNYKMTKFVKDNIFKTGPTIYMIEWNSLILLIILSRFPNEGDNQTDASIRLTVYIF